MGELAPPDGLMAETKIRTVSVRRKPEVLRSKINL